MDIGEEVFYVDYIRIIYNSKMKIKTEEFEKDEISESLLNKIRLCVNDNIISRIELKSTLDDIGMTIFCENGLSHIGIVDMYNDLIYYFVNNVKEKTLVEISGQMFERDMICQDNSLLCKIITCFAKTGKRYSHVEWIEG